MCSSLLNVLVFVERRARVSTSRVFCVDYDGPQNIALHAAIYDPLAPITSEADVDAALAGAVVSLPLIVRAALAVARVGAFARGVSVCGVL